MAKCLKCDKELGPFYIRYQEGSDALCDECNSRKLNLSRELQELKDRIVNKEDVYFYDAVYIAVDSIVNEDVLNKDFSIGTLKKLGLSGWEVVGVIPRTLGVGLLNHTLGTSANTWGAGMGGNVIGVYLILKMKASGGNVSDAFLDDYLQSK